MAAGPIVETSKGRLQGARGTHGAEFLGVPYADTAPFTPPAPVSGWAGVRDATRPGPAGPQPPREAARFTHGDAPPTDASACLNLNVFTPAREGARPVLVWLHGGGFAIGHASASIYHGARLASAADLVVVTLNYRLGGLGWLYHPDLATATGGPAGNWGLLDQLAALRWVRDNIAAFGGDPDRVTLAGQSAGALSAMDLLVVPGARGMFGRAILQSPPVGDVAGPSQPAQDWAEALSALSGAETSFDAARLRSLSADTIVALSEQLLEQPAYRGTRGGALPTVDPGSLPASPASHPGAGEGVDILVGSTRDEGSFFVNSPWRPPPPPEAMPALVARLAGVTEPERLLARYRELARESGRPDDAVAVLTDIATDAIVAGPANRWAAARAAAVGSSGGRVHRYRVDHRGAGERMGATHTVEVPLLFGTWDDGGPGQRLGGHGSGTAEVAAELQLAWARFAHGDQPGWAAMTPGASQTELGVFGGAVPFSVADEPVDRAPIGQHD